jgi:hypothetical protein
MTRPNIFKKSPWDVHNSTFVHYFYFSNGNCLAGYSKRSGDSFNETSDKVKLIFNMILRFFRDGYLDKTDVRVDDLDYMEYRDRRISKNDPEHIVSIHYTYCEWNPKYLEPNGELEPLHSFLNKFYESVNYYYKKLDYEKARIIDENKENPIFNRSKVEQHFEYIAFREELRERLFNSLYIRQRKKGPTDDEIFQLNHRTITSHAQLAGKIIDLKRQGHPAGQVDDWARKYAEKFLKS